MSHATDTPRGNAVRAAIFWSMDAGALDGVPAERLAELTGVDERTARRWKATGRIPEPARRLLAILVTGSLGLIDPAWNGWTLSRGMLIEERERMSFAPADVRAAPFIERALRAAHDRNRFSTQADWIEGRYEEPGRLSRAGGERGGA